MSRQEQKQKLEDIHYVKLVTIGSVNPNKPLSEESQREQLQLLNQCLTGSPRGVIIGKDVAIGQYQVGGHILTMEKVTYHCGFSRRPSWDKE